MFGKPAVIVHHAILHKTMQITAGCLHPDLFQEVPCGAAAQATLDATIGTGRIVAGYPAPART